MKKRVLIVDAEKREVREGVLSTLKECQDVVGGPIEFALAFPNGDCMYVNEEGLLNDPKHFFYVGQRERPFALNAYIVGSPDRDGSYTDCRMTLEEAKEKIAFVY